MVKGAHILILFTLMFLTACDNSPRDILTENYSGRVFREKPNHKDISFVPSDNEIAEFESQLDIGLSILINESEDSLIKQNGTKIIEDIGKYKRRYYGVVTIESKKMLIVNFLHPDSFSNENQWRDSLWVPKLNNYTYVSIHCYPDDKALFDLTLINYSSFPN